MIKNPFHKPWTSYPREVVSFLKTELQLGKRYVVMEVSAQESHLLDLLHDKVHLFCVVTEDKTYHQSLVQHKINKEELLVLQAHPDIIDIEDDVMDCIFISDNLLQYDPIRVAKEFERVLRLNSYVLFFQKRLVVTKDSFSAALRKSLKAYQSDCKDIAPLAPKSFLVDFFNSGLYTKKIESQRYLNWSELQEYTTSLMPDYPLAALQELYDKYQSEGRVKLEHDVELSYGLFNKSIPEISLRKSIFFNLLRPFAFGFYVLVKADIYFWKSLYKIKEKIVGK